MLPITFILQLLLLVIPSAVYAQSCSTSSTRSCSTKMGLVPNWWPAATVVKKSTAPQVLLTSTPIVTMTTTVAGPLLTATVSGTEVVTSTVTAHPETNTVYLTSTLFVTVSSTQTSTTTGVVTSVLVSTATKLQTSLIPAPSNFINVYNSSGDTNYAGTKRAIDRRRDLAARFAHDKRTSLASWLSAVLTGAIPSQNKGLSSTKKAIALNNFNNPIAVTCTDIVQKYCATNKPTTISVTSTQTPSTVTSTIKTTITSTSTVLPPAITVSIYTSTVSSTLTQYTTLIEGATSTFTQTSTISITSTTSVFAACATNNVLGPRLSTGNAISKTYFYDQNALVITSQVSSAYDCCVACQVSSFCQFFQYSGKSGQCFVTGQNANWCPNNQQDAGWPAYLVWNDPNKVTDALVVGNGVCGITMDLGQDNGQ